VLEFAKIKCSWLLTQRLQSFQDIPNKSIDFLEGAHETEDYFRWNLSHYDVTDCGIIHCTVKLRSKIDI